VVSSAAVLGGCGGGVSPPHPYSGKTLEIENNEGTTSEVAEKLLNAGGTVEERRFSAA
jgi:hypothetical protein